MIPMIPLDKYPLNDQGLPEYEIRKDGVIWNNHAQKQVHAHPKSQAVAFWNYALQRPVWYQYNYLYAYYFQAPWSDHAWVTHTSISNLGFRRHCITEDGRLWSLKYMKYVALKPGIGGRIAHTIRNDDTGKEERVLVHRLVALYYCKVPDHLKHIPVDVLEINHKDGNPANNHYTNLEWCTKSENIRHAIRTGLMDHTKREDDDTIRKICYRLKNGDGINQIARDEGLSAGLVNRVARGVSYKSIADECGLDTNTTRVNLPYEWKEGDQEKVIYLSNQGKTYTEIASMLNIPRYPIRKFMGEFRGTGRSEYIRGSIDKWQHGAGSEYMIHYFNGTLDKWYAANRKKTPVA